MKQTKFIFFLEFRYFGTGSIDFASDESKQEKNYMYRSKVTFKRSSEFRVIRNFFPNQNFNFFKCRSYFFDAFFSIFNRFFTSKNNTNGISFLLQSGEQNLDCLNLGTACVLDIDLNLTPLVQARWLKENCGT